MRNLVASGPRARAFPLFLPLLFLPFFFLCYAPATEVDVNGRARDNKRAARLNAVEWGTICCICDRLSARNHRNVFIEKANGSRDLFLSLIGRSLLIIEE